MRDARVYARRDAQLDDFADIDACRRSTKVKGGNGESRVFSLGDFIHFQGGVEGILGRTADEGDDGGRGRHGEGADAGRFGDGAVTNVAAGIRGRKAGEIKADRLAYRDR